MEVNETSTQGKPQKRQGGLIGWLVEKTVDVDEAAGRATIRGKELRERGRIAAVNLMKKLRAIGQKSK